VDCYWVGGKRAVGIGGDREGFATASIIEEETAEIGDWTKIEIEVKGEDDKPPSANTLHLPQPNKHHSQMRIRFSINGRVTSIPPPRPYNTMTKQFNPLLLH
jgi:hypothetical protein